MPRALPSGVEVRRYLSGLVALLPDGEVKDALRQQFAAARRFTGCDMDVCGGCIRLQVDRRAIPTFEGRGPIGFSVLPGDDADLGGGVLIFLTDGVASDIEYYTHEGFPEHLPDLSLLVPEKLDSRSTLLTPSTPEPRWVELSRLPGIAQIDVEYCAGGLCGTVHLVDPPDDVDCVMFEGVGDSWRIFVGGLTLDDFPGGWFADLVRRVAQGSYSMRGKWFEAVLDGELRRLRGVRG